MGLRFALTEAAFAALAKEFRRASWGAALASAAVGHQQASGLALLFGGGAWFALQLLAFILESVKDEKGEQE